MKANASGTYLFLFKIFKFGLSVFAIFRHSILSWCA